TVTTEDLDCLDSVLVICLWTNDLLLSCEHLSHLADVDRRHQRVRTWTRHVDIFNKDYLFVPVNHKAHWYLVVICFPGLEQAQHEEWSGPAGVEANGRKRKCQPQASTGPSPEASNPKLQNGAGALDSADALCVCDIYLGRISLLSPGPCNSVPNQPGLRSHASVCNITGLSSLCRPCILIMDSLKISYHESIYKLLRDYLHVEWEVRRGTRRDFTVDSMKASHCTVPVQDNSSDCGLYLLQYVESFLQVRPSPLVHFDLPLRLERWFPRQQVWRKREEIRSLVMELKEHLEWTYDVTHVPRTGFFFKCPYDSHIKPL
uniref:SUMO specific peptidase 7b n=1 Tax=Oncorhynchus kisutch TaxID=8019 RepID=A0A8C7G9R6_ONCKI